MQLQSHKSITGQGYTLIEILVALSIIGLLFGFGYASFRDFSRRQALQGTVKKIQGDLRLAQQQALSGKKPSDIKCNSQLLASYSFKVYSTSEYKIEANCGGGDVLVKDVILSSDISISIDSNPIKFKVLGQGTNIDGGSMITITLTQAGTSDKATVEVTDGGEIK